MIPNVRFTADDANRAYETWGANCGPGALAAILGKTLDEIRPFMGDFEKKGYTNPTLMLECLKRCGVTCTASKDKTVWPMYGLVRVQWEGPWLNPGVPIRARYRQTHWVGARTDVRGAVKIFDINAMSVGGWIPFEQWKNDLVPWLLKNCVPRADGGWHRTHILEVPHA